MRKERYPFCFNDGACIMIFSVDAQEGHLRATPATPDKGHKERIFHFLVDVNGTKSPNTMGKDIFTFYVYKNLDSGSPYIAPAEQWRGLAQEKIAENEQMCRTGSDAGRCTSLIFKNNSFKIPDDYTWL